VTDRYLRTAGRLRWDKRRQTFDLIVQLRVTRPADPDPEAHDRRVVAMDPGVRRFQTFYDPADGRHGVLAAGYSGGGGGGGSPTSTVAAELERRCRRLDAMRSRLDRRGWINASQPHPPGKRFRKALWAHGRGELGEAEIARCWHREEHAARRRAQRHLRRAWARLHDLKHDLHYGCINFLWRYWDTVIVSTASFGSMCQRDVRPFGSRVARQALSWSHYAFRQRLVSSAFRRAGKRVIETDEAYTTQTCGLCGVRNPNVGAATVFKCVDPACGVRVDRDVNGARNICLRVMTDLLK
jgi:putative transposase